MLKTLIGIILGIGLYLSLSYYQPIAEAHATQVEASSQVHFSFISPIPYDLLVMNN